MARARNIKPALFKNELLGQADPLLTILFTGLWCLADKKGRLEDRPLRIKAEIFPYRDLPSFNGYLTELERLGFISRYQVDNLDIIQVIKFTEHQNPHHTEKDSILPENPNKTKVCKVTVKEPLNNSEQTDRLLLIPDSLIPDSLSLIADRKPRAQFEKPSLIDIENHMLTKGLDFEQAKDQSERFYNYYESNGWKVGKNKMVNWKSSASGWLSRNNDFKKPTLDINSTGWEHE